MKKIVIGIIIAIVILGGIGYLLSHSEHTTTSTGSTIQVIAAENFYGDIASQLAGNRAHVISILTDPNVDPHEYESTVQDGINVSKAQIVIENGDGYDTWMDKLLSASKNKNRIVLVADSIATRKLEDNPHFWYGVDNVKAIAAQITAALKKQDSADSSVFDENLAKFDDSLQALQTKMATIKANYANTPVALTETIFLYQTQDMQLNVLTPLSFEQAIAEGNDPSADDVAKTNDQINNKKVKILIYNEQTVTPVTTKLLDDAKQQNIPVVPVTETMPKNKTYQSWMMGQLTDLENALRSSE
ncbi:MAG TPA: zinc ABC transporter substrate-binding protein [Patescibacteria group bacterium]|nr:zinc ABC transporter substrate-binding protein [Patescibacteria group bacterium]